MSIFVQARASGIPVLSYTPDGLPLPGTPLFFWTHLYKEYIQKMSGVHQAVGVHWGLGSFGRRA